ncbi:MAG: alpha/beta hydrolase [Planctomycetota bacterium]
MRPKRNTLFALAALALALPVLLLALAAATLYAMHTPDTPPTPRPYKTVQGHTLLLHITAPDTAQHPGPHPAILLLHGGGWQTGQPDQFFHLASDLAAQGVLAASAQYRLTNTHDSTPYDSLQDAADALRFLHQHADELNLDTTRIAAGGGSAGGHLAAALATTTAPDLLGLPPDATAEQLAALPRPAALVLFNPVIDNSPTGFGNQRLGDRWQDISPLHNLHPHMPPTVTFLGTADHLIPVATAEQFRDQMTALNTHSELHLYPDQPHGFFNYRLENQILPNPLYTQTRDQTITFLQSLGWIQPNPTP